MKSITSKLSIIILSLLAMAFTFVLGSTSSNAVGDAPSFQQCVANVSPTMQGNYNDKQYVLDSNTYAIKGIINCAKQQ